MWESKGIKKHQTSKPYIVYVEESLTTKVKIGRIWVQKAKAGNGKQSNKTGPTAIKEIERRWNKRDLEQLKKSKKIGVSGGNSLAAKWKQHT